MGFRFWRRIRIAPGVSVNFSKSGASLSLGPRGAKMTIGPTGTRMTLGLPGTGLSYSYKVPSGTRALNRALKQQSRAVPNLAPIPPTPTPNPLEQAFIDGAKDMEHGDSDSAMRHLQGALELPDAAFLAGSLAMTLHRYEDAKSYLLHALQYPNEIGVSFHTFHITTQINLPITQELTIHITPSAHGANLMLAEVFQDLHEWDFAINQLRHILSHDPNDLVVKVSLCELLVDTRSNDLRSMQEVVQLGEGVGNETEVHATMLLYKAKALRRLNMPQAALDILTVALRRTKDRSQHVLLGLRYERAQTYVELGSKDMARADYEKIYAESPDYEDVSAKLDIRMSH